jgi:hypothetical protein
MMEKNKQVSFQLKGIELLGIELNQPTKPLPEPTNFHFEISLEHRINGADKLAIVICTISIQEEDEKLKFGKIQVSCIFEVANMQVFRLESDNKIPDSMLITLNSITVSTVRGIMFAEFKGTFLHNALLPVVDPQSFTINR